MKKGELSKIAFWMGAWYLCSLVTLFMNKIILSDLGGDVHVLGLCQMVTTAVLGAAKVYGPGLCRRLRNRPAPKLKRGKSSHEALGILPMDSPERVKKAKKRASEKAALGDVSRIAKAANKHPTFWRDMVFVGLMRGVTVVLGLTSLAHVAVSFTETIKASAPLFTVIFARWMLGERTSLPVMGSLLPVMGGLMLASATELSYDTIGFLAAAANNCIDCVQNVFSKKLLRASLTPVELQFYTSVAAAILQLPVLIYTSADVLRREMDEGSSTLAWYLAVDAVSYHLQSVTAYYTMSLISPVSQSVANTLKRSLLIFLSVLYFGNPMTGATILGTMMVCAGVGLYNYARRAYPAEPEGGTYAKLNGEGGGRAGGSPRARKITL